MYFTTIDSLIGPLTLFSRGRALSGLYLSAQSLPAIPDAVRIGQCDLEIFNQAARQLSQYFEGSLKQFSLPLDWETGTDFQKSVWSELRQIAYGSTATYLQIAERLGKPTACRAVGSANGSNPISIVVPCHRVISTTGALAGYAGGLEAKRFLLRHESIHLAEQKSPLVCSV